MGLYEKICALPGNAFCRLDPFSWSDVIVFTIERKQLLVTKVW